MRTKNRTDEKLAKHYGCNVRTIGRWRKAGAPLNDPTAMRTWLAGQKHLPAGTLAILTAARRKERAAANATIAVSPPLSEGAASALRRLESSEARAHAFSIKAEASGDPIEIRAAEGRWLRIAASLLRYDLALEQSRRDTGELVLRKNIATLLTALGRSFAVGVPGAIAAGAPNLTEIREPAEIGVILKDLGRALSTAVLGYAAGSPQEWPAWMLDALTAGFDAKGQPWPAERRGAFEALVNHLCGEEAAQHRIELELAKTGWKEGYDADMKRFLGWRHDLEAERTARRAEWCRLRAAAGLCVPDASDEELKQFPGLKRV